MHWFNYGGPYGHGFMGFGPLGMIIFWTLIILAVIFITRGLFGRTSCRTGRETPLEILKRRYAAGEITDQEYEKLKTEIQN